MDTNLRGCRVLITAGAQGIGLVITESFVQAGAQVHICDVNEDALLLAQQRMPSITVSRADVADAEQVDAMFNQIGVRWGQRLDVLINNAGIAGPTAGLAETSLDGWNQTISVNLTGAFLCARRATPMLKLAGGGAIINMSSTAGRLGFPLRTPYSASKFALIGLTQTWAMELGPSKIRVNAILPGVVAGERQERVIAAKAASFGIGQEAMRERVLAKVSLRSMVSAQDIANQIMFICSPAGSSITGQSLSVDGNVEHLG